MTSAVLNITYNVLYGKLLAVQFGPAQKRWKFYLLGPFGSGYTQLSRSLLSDFRLDFD